MTRIAIVHKDKCNQEACGGMLCAKVCPINMTGAECVKISEENKAIISEELCTGCGICPKKCPTKAIDIINLPEMLTTEPIHRYGENTFALFNLPIPTFGKVVGIVGRNGIGKSTAMKILSGLLKPNFGKTGYESTYDELIDHFKGTEAQGYFEKVRDKKITIAYKPQQVEQIPKTFDGTVRELLEKYKERDILDKVIEELQLKNFLDHNVKDISGGELQRVAIAVTAIRKANVYFFDEPTSYLDIKQRIHVSKFIREMADQETAVMVIEHDLIILDMMSDAVHMVFGKEDVYGIVSQPRSTKAGINVYLSGYLREENMRFRDHKIVFEGGTPRDSSNDNLLCQWPDIDKKIGGVFELKATKGDIFKHDVIGILGENGIGKTSFVRELVGIEGETKTGDMKIAYKPQYIDTSDEQVISVLGTNFMKYEHTIIKPLDIEMLFDKPLNELSGGQLQRVMIAKTLIEDADLYLLDEPSAYLDIEQRLLVAKIIRDVMIQKGKACLVVDHDLLFADYLSEKLIVFDGQPAIRGEVKGPYTMSEGMNVFLEDLNITFRRDEENGRPRINKPDSVMDREQKSSGKLYYTNG
jgi:ATP-binding cassette subfamily E protein 1